MTKSKRKLINVQLGNESFYNLLDQKTPDEVISEMLALSNQHGDRKIYFNISPYGYDGGLELELWETREENDKELAARRAQEAKEREKEKKRKLTNSEKEFKEYLRLQKKFQGKSEFQ